MESICINVPVMYTIDIVLKHVYKHPGLNPPLIPKQTLQDLLILCTTMTSFRSLAGDLYQQIDGMMGSCLGPTLSELENLIYQRYPEKAPIVYARYVDDKLILVETVEQLLEVKQLFEIHSVLKFTYEIVRNSQLAFLDVHVHRQGTSLTTSVFVKPTNNCDCINNDGVAPEGDKTGVI